MIKIWKGAEALSDFRLASLKKAIADAIGQNVGINAEFVYLLDMTEDFTPAEAKHYAALLEGATPSAPSSEGFFVTPRKGTISPWSTKASQILSIAGCVKVRRVERGIHYTVSDRRGDTLPLSALAPALNAIHDRMTEGVYTDLSDFFDERPPAPGRTFDVLAKGRAALEEANTTLGLAMSDDEIAYLEKAYKSAGRNPTDTELVMFGQVNSEHCRHKIFNAEWTIDGAAKDSSLFGMIKSTHKAHPQGTLVAYKDNSSVVEGFETEQFAINPGTKRYEYGKRQLDLLMKVETHNHPTAISPFPGAATGVGGEIRDESATGTGSRSKAGLAGFMVSNLRLPGAERIWEKQTADKPFPSRLATPLDIMIDGPIGGARFGNEFGRPQLAGFFRTFEIEADGRFWGYHKPIMLAGGMGSIDRRHIEKKPIPAGSWIVQIGGPAMRIGLGGGAASSMATGTNAEALDFDSVQRGNAEMERRCQEVIETCCAMGDKNPILAIHDIGAGGLSNACPEIVEDVGADFELREVHNEEPSMNPMEIWCCEAQERYMLAIRKEDRAMFEKICARERCPAAFIGVARDDRHLLLHDSHFGDNPIDMDIGTLLGKPPRMHRDVRHVPFAAKPLDLSGVVPQQAFENILRMPCVASKNFLVTIGDRTVTGQVHRDQMAGPYQLPLSDCAVTMTGFHAESGEAMAIGERSPIAVLDAPASGRMAVGEALTNICAAWVGDIGRVKLSANWMCACGEDGEDARLYDTVEAVAAKLCTSLGISIPVGKDSCSMRSVWNADGKDYRQQSPLSLCVSAFSPVDNVRHTLTPDFKRAKSALILVDLSAGKNRLGGSVLAQTLSQTGDTVPDFPDTELFLKFFATMQSLVADGLLLSYHDRSDGGAAVALCEMAFGGGRGFDADLPAGENGPLGALFSEELGAVLEVDPANADEVVARFRAAGLVQCVSRIGHTRDDRSISIAVDGKKAISGDVCAFRSIWTETTHAMQALRDNPKCADEEFALASDATDPGMKFRMTYEPDETRDISLVMPPRIAILREQGVNGHVEMAAAFREAGCEAVDVHMTDILEGRASLADFEGLVACGGFSYGDVLGSGTGWAAGILNSPKLSKMFKDFFRRSGTLSLGVCNGCQMLSQLKGLIPGAEHWPRFVRNESEQFEARFETVEVVDSPSVFLRGMAGSILPIAVAHGDGRAEFAKGDREALLDAGLLAVRYVGNDGKPTDRYPWNPNGTPGGLTGFTTPDGRATIMMPHPERGFRALQLSYRPAGFCDGYAGPWLKMFRNAYAFLAKK